MAKPDHRQDNVEKLQEMVQNTLENHRETEEYLEHHGDQLAPDQRREMEQNNRNREESIKGLREEIKDEARFQRKQK